MSARSAVLTRYEGARIRIPIGATTRTVTKSRCARLTALLDEDVADMPGVRALRRARPLTEVPAAAPRRHSQSSLWDLADAIVPGLIWIAGLLFAAGALPL